MTQNGQFKNLISSIFSKCGLDIVILSRYEFKLMKIEVEFEYLGSDRIEFFECN
jgi:hypothetical protein